MVEIKLSKSVLSMNRMWFVDNFYNIKAH